MGAEINDADALRAAGDEMARWIECYVVTAVHPTCRHAECRLLRAAQAWRALTHDRHVS